MSWRKPEPKGPAEAEIGSLLLAARRHSGNNLGRAVGRVELGKAVDIPPNRIRWHEGGDVMLRAHEVVKIAEFLQIPPGRLLRRATLTADMVLDGVSVMRSAGAPASNAEREVLAGRVWAAMSAMER
jgi:hypothetical protein